MMNDPKTIAEILANTHTIAVVGFSSSTARAGYYVPAYLQGHGYRIIPVNPNITTGLGHRAYPDLHAVPEPVDLVLVFRRSEHVPDVVEQAIDIGAKAIWLQQGIVLGQAAARARAAGLAVVQDACMMVEHRAWRRRG
ncbi:MAG: CoA-binding protein [Caldilineae bacterium]|nr:MAG: CoA-binding protein [Caldilineae bacterium]